MLIHFICLCWLCVCAPPPGTARYTPEIGTTTHSQPLSERKETAREPPRGGKKEEHRPRVTRSEGEAVSVYIIIGEK